MSTGNIQKVSFMWLAGWLAAVHYRVWQVLQARLGCWPVKESADTFWGWRIWWTITWLTAWREQGSCRICHCWPSSWSFMSLLVDDVPCPAPNLNQTSWICKLKCKLCMIQAFILLALLLPIRSRLGLSGLQQMIDLGLGHDRVMGLRLNLRISSGSLLWQDTLIIVQEMDITLPDLRPLYNSFYSAATGSYPDKSTDVSSKEEILVERLCSWILTVIPGISECMAQYVQAQLQRLGSENNEVSFLSTRSARQCTCLGYLP
jgi:hypothetical protein